MVFLEESGRNRTPDKLPKPEKEKLHEICDAHLLQVVKILKPKIVVGVGKFAKDRAQTVLANEKIAIRSVLHPSPASPAANRGWAAQAEEELRDAGVLKYMC